MRGDHRVRLPDGRDVHRPAVPAERARLSTARGGGRRSCRRSSAWWWSRRVPRSWWRRRGARFTLLIGYVFCFLGFLTMLLLWKEDIPYWKVGLGVRVHRDRGRVRGNAGVAFAHRLGPGPTRGHGLRDGRSAAGPRWRDHAVDLRRAPHGRVRGGVRRRDRRGAERRAGHRQRPERSSRSRSPAPRRPRSSTRSTRSRSPRRRRRRSSQGDHGPTPPGSSRSCSAPSSCSSSSRRRTTRCDCSPSIARRTRRCTQDSACGSGNPVPLTTARARRRGAEQGRPVAPRAARARPARPSRRRCRRGPAR